jgi:hypothetical protein
MSSDSEGASAAEQTFESLRDRISSLAAAKDPNRRDIVWADAQQRIGLARDTQGRIELFVAGEELVPTLSTVRDRVEYQRWFIHDGEPFDANRLILPSASHFDAVTALICVELVDNGFHRRPREAFKETEPVIDLALRRAGLGSEPLIGLIGELVLLDALLGESPAAAHETFLAWFGYKPSTRDFQLGQVGVEVKTTTGPASTHVIHGVHQVELGVSVGGEPETRLFLVSLGVRWLDDQATGGLSLPDVVDAVLSRLADDEDRSAFLAAVRSYGGDSAVGYNHHEDRHRRRFRRRFELRFERCYDMLDEAIQVLRSSQLDGLVHIDPDSLTYRVVLPNQVRGDLNPRVGLSSIANHLLAVPRQ